MPIFPSVATVQVGVNFTATVRLNNTSSNSGADGTASVPATITPSSVIPVRLACKDASCATQLPGTVTFNSCTPNAGVGVASCVLDPGDPTHNTVLITVGATGVPIAAGGRVDLAVIDLQGTTPVPQGFFFMHGITGLRACSTVNPANRCCTDAFATSCSTDSCATSATCTTPPNTVCTATVCALGGASGSSLLDFPEPIPTPTDTVTPTRTPTVTGTPAQTPTRTSTVTPTGTQTPTPVATGTFTQTPTPTSCGVEVPQVDPVTSPTNLLQQTLAGQARLTGARWLSVCSEAGCVSCSIGSPDCTATGSSFAVSVPLAPLQVNHVRVCDENQNTCGGPAEACTTVEITQTCAGDCGGTFSVTVDELLTMVNIALGNIDVSACRVGDANHDGHITVDEILMAVGNALNGCPGQGTARSQTKMGA
jgi:hypothetical protein